MWLVFSQLAGALSVTRANEIKKINIQTVALYSLLVGGWNYEEVSGFCFIDTGIRGGEYRY